MQVISPCLKTLSQSGRGVMVDYKLSQAGQSTRSLPLVPATCSQLKSWVVDWERCYLVDGNEKNVFIFISFSLSYDLDSPLGVNVQSGRNENIMCNLDTIHQFRCKIDWVTLVFTRFHQFRVLSEIHAMVFVQKNGVFGVQKAEKNEVCGDVCRHNTTTTNIICN